MQFSALYSAEGLSCFLYMAHFFLEGLFQMLPSYSVSFILPTAIHLPTSLNTTTSIAKVKKGFCCVCCLVLVLVYFWVGWLVGIFCLSEVFFFFSFLGGGGVG